MHQKSAENHHFIIIGAGPAGLTAAHELTRQGHPTTILEKLGRVGGIARTEKYKGYHFDMGGHRFFTKSAEIQQFWHNILGPDLLHRPRLSRIYFNNKYYNYPLRPLNAMHNLGPLEATRIILSYIRWHIFPYQEEESFEHWVTNRFGKRLFETFFKTYTEKVWGIPCSELKAEWAAQRIQNLSLRSALLSMFVKPNGRITSLIESFHYPRRGPGQMWQTVRERVEQQGGHLHLDSSVIQIGRTANKITHVIVNQNGRTHTIPGTHFISTMPIAQFLQRLDPPPPTAVLTAANSLRYRDFLTVCLIINRPHLFPDNWIYIHEPGVQVGRIQNFKNWSAEMVPDPNTTSLGLEYFCNHDDPLWSMTDADLITLGKQEIEKIGLAKAADVTDGCVFRVPKSYPIYDSAYRSHLETIKSYLNGLENFQTIGRNGLHRYNNQDHAMLTGLLAVKNILNGEKHNLWHVNAEEEYLEEMIPSANKPGRRKFNFPLHPPQKILETPK